MCENIELFYFYINYWPLDEPGIDIVSGNNLINFVNYNFGAYDRKEKMDASIQFEGGYALLPSDVYFDPTTGGLSFMLWVKVESASDGMLIFDFDSVQVNVDQINAFIIYIRFIAKEFQIQNVYPVLINDWFHLAVSYDLKLNTFYFYKNGVNVMSKIKTG